MARMSDIIHREAAITRLAASLEPVERVNGAYSALIAVNDDVGDGQPIDLRSMDMDAYMKNPVVLLAHDRWSGIPVGQTKELAWTNRGLEAKFTFLQGDPVARRVENAWKRGYLRAASIGARPREKNSNVHELIEWSIVPVPADKDAVRTCRAIMNDILGEGENEMDEAAIRAIIEEALKSRSDDKPLDAKELAESLSRGMADAIKEAVEASETARAQAEKAKADAEAEIEKRIEAEVAERAEKAGFPFKKKMGDKKKAEKEKAPGDDDDDDDEETMAKKAAEEADERAEARAELLIMTRGLLPKEFEARGKTDHEILVAAAGDEVENASERSEDYLRAKVEDIAKRREDAAKNRGGGDDKTRSQIPMASGRINLVNLKARAAK